MSNEEAFFTFAVPAILAALGTAYAIYSGWEYRRDTKRRAARSSAPQDKGEHPAE